MTGHVRRRGENSWEMKYDVGADPLTGRRRIRYHSFKGGKRKAEQRLAELVAAAKNGDDVDPEKMTLGDFLDRWERDTAANSVSPKTLERYKELARLHIRPALGDVKLQKLRPDKFSALYAKLLRDGRTVREGGGGAGAPRVTERPPLSRRTVGHVHRLLHCALAHAANLGLIVRSPVATLKAPKVEGAELEILTEDQARAVLHALRGKALHPIVMLALSTGMRRGELLALRWKDIDLDAGRLRVERSIEQTKAGLRVKPPKTKHGKRVIGIPASVVAELRTLHASQLRLRRSLEGVPPEVPVLGRMPDEALVFANWDGEPRKPNSTTTEWRRLVRVHGLPRVSFHALRHTHASQLIASGLDVIAVSRRLGHGSPTITLGVYGHLWANTDDRASAVVEAAFARTLEQ